MKLTADYWIKYINIHTSANKAAEKRMERYIEIHGTDDMDKLSDYAYALVTKYGEAATALSCEMYDKLARAQKVDVPDAMPAETATYGEVAKAVRGAAKRSTAMIPDVVGRLVKQAGADTTLQNAKRDNAWFAWVSHGDTCPYCMALAGLGWQKAGELTLKGGHAEHIHANCDCEYVIDLKGNLEIEGYDPNEINQQLLDMADGEYDAESLIRMSGHNAKGHDHTALNIVRRKQYAANKEYINAQKRERYRIKSGGIKQPVDNINRGNYNNFPLDDDELRRRYERDVESGWISALCGFDNYKYLYYDINNRVIGVETLSGIKIQSQSDHFLARVIGTSLDPSRIENGVYKITGTDPQGFRSNKRDGVRVNDIVDALENGRVKKVKTDKNGLKSMTISGKKCMVTINPDTGNLIQCNPSGWNQ